MGIELNVANMSSPLIKLGMFLVFNLFMAKPEKTFAGAHQGGELEVVRTKDHLEMIMICVCLLMQTFWFGNKISSNPKKTCLSLPIQRRRSQCREEMRRWGIGACLAQLPDIRMIVILVTCCRIWWWLWSWWRRPGSPSLWGSGRCRFWRSRDIWGDRTRPEGSRCLIWRYCDHDDSDDGKEDILTEHETANIPHVADDGLGLDQLLDDRPDDDQQVVCADHHIPDEDGDDLLSHTLGDENFNAIVNCQRNTFERVLHNMHNMFNMQCTICTICTYQRLRNSRRSFTVRFHP